MYGVIGKCRIHNIAFDCKIHMFDKKIKPILSYGYEVWDFDNTNLLEKLHLRFCKHILNLRASTPNFIVYEEHWRNPIIIMLMLEWFHSGVNYLIFKTQNCQQNFFKYWRIFLTHGAKLSKSLKSMWINIHVYMGWKNNKYTWIKSIQYSIRLI